MQIVFYVVSPNNQAHEDRRKEIQKEMARTGKNEKKKRAKIGMKRQLETQICFGMWPLVMEMMRLKDVSMEWNW